MTVKIMPGFKHKLHAYLGQKHIATLGLTQNNELAFFYDEAWQIHGYSLSPHLPLDNSVGTSQTSIKAFFQNYFPEGENFDILLGSFHLSRHNVFAITQTLGLDLPGALQIIPEGSAIPIDAKFRLIDPSEIAERLSHYSAQNLVIWDGKPRLSVAGVHQKINVVLNDRGDLGFGEGALCSTHILKFERSSAQYLVLNEFLMMSLASRVGLHVAEVTLKYFDEFPALLVKRFDRSYHDNTVARRPVIDGCQALNLSPEYKYERNLGSGRDVKNIREGASLPALFSFCDDCRNPAVAKKQLLDWVLFNILIGNLDAHGKNISFFVSALGIEPAPLYDLICTRIYPEFSQELAMALGDEFDSAAIGAYQLADFADTCGLPRAIVSSTLLALCDRVIAALPMIQKMTQNGPQAEFAQKLISLIQAQAIHMREQTALISGVKL